MKKFYTLFITLLLLAFLGVTNCFAQVDVSTGGPSTPYTTLKLAFDAINAGIHTGSITIGISGNPIETASAVLNFSGSGPASYTDILIRPTGGLPRSISGNIPGHLIDLNGADNVTIDGLDLLTITNISTIGSSTIRFTADATNNTVTHCFLQGATAIFGVVYFGSGTATGNDDNVISNCNIGPTSEGNPLNGIYSMNLSAGTDNSGNNILNNNIFDYFNTGLATCGMNINSGNSAWIITNNKLYQTVTRLYSSPSTHNGIFITSGSGYTITDNIIGFANSLGTGTTNMIGLTSGSVSGIFPTAYTVTGAANATKYVGINCAFAAGGTVSSIQNNLIAGFALYTSSSTSSALGVFCGIAVNTGNVNIGTLTGNTIGSPASSIYTVCTSSGGAIGGIYVTSSNTVNIQNNVLQNLDAMGATATTCGSINGINTDGANGTFVVSGNTIGNPIYPNLRMGNLMTGANLSNIGTTFSTTSGTSLFQGIRNAQTGNVTIGTITAPNIVRNAYLNSSGSVALLRGIYSTGGTTNISYNTVTSLTSASSGTSYTSAGLAGIGILVTATTNPVISNNTISGLSLTNIGTGGYTLAGIVYNTPSGIITVANNTISELSNASTSISATAPGTATGIFIRDGGGANTNIYNNMISLGNGQTSNTAFIGIWSQSNASVATTLKIYYNSINIEGIVIAGAQPSMCFQRGEFSTTAGTVFTIDARNNIFNNTRSGGTGKHYALTNNYGVAISSPIGWGANATDYNVLNSNAATIGYWSGDQTFASWKTASSCDGNSISAVPITFTNAPKGNLHLNMGTTPTHLESGGTVIPAVTTDYDGQNRPGPTGSVNGGATAPDFGADEFDGVPFNIPLTLTGTVANVTCNGMSNGSITTVTGGGQPPYTYLWSNSATTADISGLTAGIYTVTVTDFLSATITGSWTITEPAAIILSAVVRDELCPQASDGDINLTVTGGTPPYTYLWSNLALSEDIAGLTAGTYSVTVTDAAFCATTGSWTVVLTHNLCEIIYVSGNITTTDCYNAHKTIYVGGAATPFTVVSGGAATFIAGESITFLEGTQVLPGGNMLAYISSGTYCGGLIYYIPAVVPVQEEAPVKLEQTWFTIYPNPTSGNFTIVQKGDRQYGNVKVEVYGMRGNKVLNSNMTGIDKQEFATSGLPAGLYIIKVIADDYTETIKLIKTR